MNPWDELSDVGATKASDGIVLTCQFNDGSIPRWQSIYVSRELFYKLLAEMLIQHDRLRHPLEADAAGQHRRQDRAPVAK